MQYKQQQKGVMKNKEMNPEALSRPDGVEVKLSAKGINIRALILFFVLFLIGTIMFVYIWGEFSAYGVGYELVSVFKGGRFYKLMFLLFVLAVVYTFLQAGILYWFSGKDRKALRWQSSWSGTGFYLARPIALKYYRVSLLLPAILLGVLPTIHGFCTGSGSIYYLGLYMLLCASADATFWYKLRAFDDEDLLLAGKKPFEATIIKRNYDRT